MSKEDQDLHACHRAGKTHIRSVRVAAYHEETAKQVPGRRTVRADL